MSPGTGSAVNTSPLRAWLVPAIAPLALPVAILLACYLLAPYVPLLPPTLSGLVDYAPIALLVLATLLAAAFGRSRIMLAALAILGGVTLLGWTDDQVLLAGVARQVSQFSLYGLVPLNLALISCYRDRGVTSGYGNFRMMLLVMQGVAVSIVVAYPQPELARLVDMTWLSSLDVLSGFLPPTLSPLSALALAIALLTVFARAYWDYSPSAFALLGALCAYLLALVTRQQAEMNALFTCGAALQLAVAVLRESHSMAFRDELTGLPQRRALEGQMMALAGTYTVAMVDIDRFKKFNDQYGHDIGDQVLQMVAAQIGQVKGNGRAYRYGGEEFCIVFPRRTLERALPHLEEVRQRIAEYHMVIREANRPEESGDGKASKSRKRGSFREASKQVSVTISIGAAEREQRGETPDEVVKRADEALYRAKRGGRNRVES